MIEQWNIWIGVSTDMQPELVGVVRGHAQNDDGSYIPEPAVEFPALNNMAAATIEFFSNVFDADATSKLFKGYTTGGKTYKVWSVYALKPDDAAQVRSDLDAMAATYAQDFKLLGFWRTSDGVPLGVDYDDSDPPLLVGTAAYPTPAWAVNFMPDVEGSPAAEITDVILIAGQASKVFI